MSNDVTLDPNKKFDSMSLLYWMAHEPKGEVPPSLEEAIIQAAESLADPNFFIAEISGLLSALVELKSVCYQRRERLKSD